LAFIALVALLLLILHIPYPVVVLGCGLLGFLLPPEAGGADLVATADPTKSDWRKSFRVALVIIGIWVLPVLGFFLWLGAVAMPLKIAFFYIRVSLFSFGGAYAALSYVSLHAVHNWGWVTQDQMIDGLGLAETTPGPLLIALQFVAFLAAYYTAGNLPPLLSATLGSLLALWSLFLPSFLWIFTFAPHLERIARNRRMEGALKAIGAVVTAVIAALAFWFAGSVFLKSGTSTFCVSWQPLIITIFCFLALRSTQVEIALLIVLSGVAGVFLKLVF
jgi:chromate transporter